MGIKDDPPAVDEDTPDSKTTEVSGDAEGGVGVSRNGESTDTGESASGNSGNRVDGSTNKGDAESGEGQNRAKINAGSNRNPDGTADKTRAAGGGRQPPPPSNGDRTFVSYIATHPDDDEGRDPDGLDQEARMRLEENAIELILGYDDRLRRTVANNRGFDLYEPDADGKPVRWVEIKAMTGELTDRPVCLSRAQFDCAWIQGEAYWLYIVEHAGNKSLARVLRIQDPAGQAKNFSFDRGWAKIAAENSGNAGM